MSENEEYVVCPIMSISNPERYLSCTKNCVFYDEEVGGCLIRAFFKTYMNLVMKVTQVAIDVLKKREKQ